MPTSTPLLLLLDAPLLGALPSPRPASLLARLVALPSPRFLSLCPLQRSPLTLPFCPLPLSQWRAKVQVPADAVPQALLRVLRQRRLLRPVVQLHRLLQHRGRRGAPPRRDQGRPRAQPERVPAQGRRRRERAARRRAGHQAQPRLQLPQVRLPQKVLRVLPGRRRVLRPLRLRRLQERPRQPGAQQPLRRLPRLRRRELGRRAGQRRRQRAGRREL